MQLDSWMYHASHAQRLLTECQGPSNGCVGDSCQGWRSSLIVRQCFFLAKLVMLAKRPQCRSLSPSFPCRAHGGKKRLCEVNCIYGVDWLLRCSRWRQLGQSKMRGRGDTIADGCLRLGRMMSQTFYFPTPTCSLTGIYPSAGTQLEQSINNKLPSDEGRKYQVRRTRVRTGCSRRT